MQHEVEQFPRDEDPEEDESETHHDDPLEPPAPIDVKPIWDGPTPPSRGVVIAFPLRRSAESDEQEPPRTLH